jgi:subtilisin family serine protease
MSAIVWATDYGVDIINLSLGTDHFSNDEKGCDHTGSQCGISEAADYAVEQGVVLVTAAGNSPGANAVCCPALSDAAICVGGCVAECTATPSNSNNRHSTQAFSSRPPPVAWG